MTQKIPLFSEYHQVCRLSLNKHFRFDLVFNSIKSATEAATMILRIDGVIAAGKTKAPPAPPGGPGGMPGAVRRRFTSRIDF